MSRFTQCCLLFAVALYVYHVIEAVRISPVHDSVQTTDEKMEVILPCRYTTDSNGKVQIEWHYIHEHTDELVLRVESTGVKTSGLNYSGRVDKGKGASLILKKPKKQDSGVYRCDVQIAEDEEALYHATRNLTVAKVGCKQGLPCAECGHKKWGPIVMIVMTVLALLIGFAIAFTALCKKGSSKCCRIKGKMSNQFHVVRISTSLLSVGLCIGSIILLGSFLARRCSTELQGISTAGYVCAGISIAISFAIALVNGILKKQCRRRQGGDKRNNEGNPEEHNLTSQGETPVNFSIGEETDRQHTPPVPDSGVGSHMHVNIINHFPEPQLAVNPRIRSVSTSPTCLSTSPAL